MVQFTKVNLKMEADMGKVYSLPKAQSLTALLLILVTMATAYNFLHKATSTWATYSMAIKRATE